MSYERFRRFVQDHRREFLLVLAFVVVFFAGVGTGKGTADKRPRAGANMLNYTTPSPTPAPTVTPSIAPITQVTATPVTAATPTTSEANCVVKGNISSTGKIYHTQGGSFYARVKPEQCFVTEAEAQAAGFRKSSR
ncbi:MAG: hypothetical protein KBD66_00725 [Candidatus Doudnabacteria bacterium]|nr:hypothetical protein [Candidatus Doudnabacteria bacterium]